MSQNRPFKRTVRQFTEGNYSPQGWPSYIQHPKFAIEPRQYIRSFYVIQKDLIDLFDYIEPHEANLETFSFRIHELFIRASIEVEANFKAILRENEYSKKCNLTMLDYQKVNTSHFLSEYAVKMPDWRGGERTFSPFHEWGTGTKLTWYAAYNKAKHDRHNEFSRANLGNLLLSITALIVLLRAQFFDGVFSSEATLFASFGPSDGFTRTFGDSFTIKAPENLPALERYSFDWETIKSEDDPFVNFPYEPPSKQP